jgi:hypothetical protein
MDRSHRSDSPPGAAGDRPWRPSLGLLALAAVLVGGVLVYGWRAASAPAPAADSASQASVVAAPSAPAPGASRYVVASAASASASAASTARAASAPVVRHIVRNRDPNGDQSPDLSDYVNEGERPTMAQVIDRLHQAGVHTGLGAFQPPGTRPPLVGLAVPEDFVLPPGYVRHYQATDDGQRIEPILMFSPDVQLHDAAGRPVAIPKDRVVPPEMAPPGLPIRRVVIPAPLDDGSAGN